MKIGRVLQLDEGERQAVDEDDEIGPAGFGRTADRKLVDDEKFVGGEALRGEIDEPKVIVFYRVALPPAHAHTGEKQAVKVTIALFGDGVIELAQSLHRLVEHSRRHTRIKPRQRTRKASDQDHLAIVCPFRRRAVVRDVGPEDRLPATFAKPAEALSFELVFGDHDLGGFGFFGRGSFFSSAAA